MLLLIHETEWTKDRYPQQNMPIFYEQKGLEFQVLLSISENAIHLSGDR